MEDPCYNQELLSNIDNLDKFNLLSDEIKEIVKFQIKKTQRKVNLDSLKELLEFFCFFKNDIKDYDLYVNGFGDLTIEIIKNEKTKIIYLFREGGNTVYCCKDGNKIIQNECDIKDIINGNEEPIIKIMKLS